MDVIYNNTSENVDEENGFDMTFAAVLTFIIMIVGMFGNFLTVIALLKCPKVRNVAAAFILSLCLADLLFCAFVLPFSALRFIEGTWTHGDVLCKMIPFIQYGNIGVSLLCIAMITINRYVMIAHHSSYAKIYKKHWIAVMIAFCWLFSYGMQLPTLLGAWGVFDYDPKLGTCSIMSDANGRSSKTTLFITAFVIPCIIIIACYAKIFWVVRKSELRLKQHAHKQNTIPNNQRPIATTADATTRISMSSSFSTDTAIKAEACVQKQARVKDQRDMRAKRNEWRITKMVLAIFLSFVICYLPITLAKVVDKDVAHPAFHIFSYIMLYLSACINPIIYVIMNKQYRKAYKTVIMCEPSKLLPFGKTNGGAGGSSAAEKWKDIGLSNNHSRTMVSQMSAAEGHSSSCSSNSNTAQAAVITALEMTSKLNTTSVQSRENTTSLPVRNMNPFSQSNSDIGSNNNNVPPMLPTSPIPTSNNSVNSTRIALAGGDIILEEEEEEPPTTATTTPNGKKTPPPPPMRTTPPASAAAHDLSDELKLAQAIGNRKKIQSYGQNINAIPDNTNLKLMTKEKISKD